MFCDINIFSMHRIKAIVLLAVMQLTAMMLTAQKPDTASASIDFKLDNNKATFNSSLRPLRQIAGAPEAFYTHFWEFGDGKFSFEKQPRHIYKDTGTYDVIYYATNNYDDGKPPPRRRKKIPVKQKVLFAQQSTPSFFKKDGAVEMKVNRQPSPDEDMVLIIGYRNETNITSLNGSLLLFYNEKLFKAKNFELAEERTYHGEKSSALSSIAFTGNEIIETSGWVVASGPATDEIYTGESFFAGRFANLLKTKQQIYSENKVWKFENLQKGEEKYFFITLHTTPEMIKDTNAVVVLNGMFVPDDPNGELQEYELELQIVASHDPNRMMLRNRRLNYRFTGANKEMTYKVRFQNTGKGAASQISIGIAVPSMMDSKSLEVMDLYPKCIPCDSAYAGQSCLDTMITKDSIHFVFKNIYLPGIRQDGFREPDSTQGFIKYQLRFGNKPKKISFESSAAIVFDKNEPVYTNGSRGYFKPGNSPGIIVGYNKWMDIGNKNRIDEDYWMAGASVSSYSPYKKYLQWELFAGMINQPEQLISRGPGRDTMVNSQLYFQQNIDLYEKRKITKLAFVPLQLRYNISDWVGAGIGSMVSTDAIIKISAHRDMLLRPFVPPPVPPIVPLMLSEKLQERTEYFKNWDVAAFADLQLGKVRVGPAVGIRFLHYFKNPQNRLLVYATWRL